jgi:predicted aspartyl protease
MVNLRHCWSAALAMLLLSLAPARSESACTLGLLAELPVTMAGLRPLVSAQFNGSEALLLVDSGAFYSMLSPLSAAGLKLKSSSARGLEFRIETLTGEIIPEVTTIKEFSIAKTRITSLQFFVGGTVPGSGVAGLLGQNVLGTADVEYDFANRVVRLMKPLHCGQASLAYWASSTTVPYSVMGMDPGGNPHPVHTAGDALLNGKRIRVVFDTGVAASTLTLAAARRVGIGPDSPGVISVGPAAWIGSFASLRLGDEEMRNVHLHIGDFSMDEGDLLLGADFFLSHRIYVANSQEKLYFTYNGGPPFDLTPIASPGEDSGLRSVRLSPAAQLQLDRERCNICF